MILVRIVRTKIDLVDGQACCCSLLTLGDVDIVSWVSVEGCEGGVHVHAMLEMGIVSYVTVTISRHLSVETGTLTEARTLLSAESSSSMRSFSCIKLVIESLARSRGASPDVGPEDTVGAWILSSMGMPILRKG